MLQRPKLNAHREPGVVGEGPGLWDGPPPRGWERGMAGRPWEGFSLGHGQEL